MSKYFDNSYVGLTYGLVQITAGQSESDYQTLDLEKHPKKSRPTVVLTPVGEIANLNAYIYEITWVNDTWKWKAATSLNATGSSNIDINYQVMSTWA